ncbi:CvpA family protein [Patescibacteria group bacterium]|nr:CvpA family protein [Patescibacteria group bacterium]MBU4512013.1 CvpA family protein [Patescibacteria group bacterium]MCG2693210.1 CvpA family protein [Candidatus Parcubacteria bacterium]
MNILDIILLVLLFLFFLTGFWRGLIKTVGGFVGLVLGIFIAGVFYEDLAGWVTQYIPWSEKVLTVVVFILIFVITARLIDFIFCLLDRIFKFFTIIPFLKTINRLAGGVFGLLQGVVFLGLCLFVYSKFAFWSLLDGQLLESQIAPALIFLVKFLLLLLPDALKEIEGLL